MGVCQLLETWGPICYQVIVKVILLDIMPKMALQVGLLSVNLDSVPLLAKSSVLEA